LKFAREAAGEFRAYETARGENHDGLRRADRARDRGRIGSAGASTFREIHIVSFPDGAALDAYRRDPELRNLAAMRERAVESTIVVRGRDRKFSYSFQ
jgi:hypothetical protein